jgi:hypothetical protein
MCARPRDKQHEKHKKNVKRERFSPRLQKVAVIIHAAHRRPGDNVFVEKVQRCREENEDENGRA